MIGTSVGGRRRGRVRRAAGWLLAGLLAFAAVGAWLAAPDAEGNLATEKADQAQIVANMLAIQKKFAADQHRPLARGTHAKGICARGTFEVFDVARTISDAALASRLARGPYTRPGSFPASVRFANGESHIYPDSTPDVRALSFAVDMSSAGGGRQDYSMNNATTFPLNDAHEFAVATQVVVADRMSSGFMALPLVDKFGFARTAALGRMQQKPPGAAYQTTRYWSTVPYRHGAEDVVKYSAIPCASNASRPLGTGPDALQDELRRHLADDTPTGCFDFALQLLDAERMTRFGMRRSRTYWIENASVEWHEDQAPFHAVGRLTLEPRSAMSAEACDAQHIDVTENSTEETRPVGSINRARWAAESASRKARAARAPAAADQR